MRVNRCILLVDDDDNDLALARTVLAEAAPGLELVTLHDGAEALDYLHRRGEFAGRADGAPVLVLLDIKMLKVDGIAVLQSIKSDPGLKNIPVVMLTSSNQPKDLADCYGRGANGYVVKPADFARFETVLGQIVGYWALSNEPPPG